MNSKTLKNIIKELDFLRKTAIIQWNTWKKKLFLANKLIEKITDSRNAKEHCQSFIRKKPHKISITIRNNYLSPKIFWKPKQFWYKINCYETSKPFT